jgi:hypothetical protein
MAGFQQRQGFIPAKSALSQLQLQVITTACTRTSFRFTQPAHTAALNEYFLKNMSALKTYMYRHGTVQFQNK